MNHCHVFGHFGTDALASGKKEALKDVVKAFEQAGITVTDYAVNNTVKRQAGSTYRQANFTFADSQTVSLHIKQTGDIFEVLINNKKFAIKDQENHDAAIQEIVKELDKRRTAWQKSLNKAKATLPTGMSTAIVRKEVVLQTKIADIDKAVADGQALLEEKKKKLSDLNAEISQEEAKKKAA